MHMHHQSINASVKRRFARLSWGEVDKMLDVYIYDHLVKKKLYNIAKSFMTEGKLSPDHVGKAIDTPGGLLFEWWSMFWDISIAKTKQKRSESAVEQGLNVYIYDYLVKKKLYHTAESFMPEVKAPLGHISINTPGGFLSKWWFVFWDFFIARVTEKHYESVAQAQQGKEQEHMKQPNPMNTVQENNSGVNLGASPRQQDPLLTQQNNRKRARTGNTVGPFNSQPSTPLTPHTPNEGVAITGDMQHVNNMPKGPVMYGSSDAIGGLASSANQLMWDDMEAFEDLGDLEDNAEWFLPQVDGNLQQSDMESFGALEDVDIESVFKATNWNPSEFIERQQGKEQEQMKQPNPMNSTETSQPHMDPRMAVLKSGTTYHGEMVHGNHQGGSVLASLQQLNSRTQQTPFEAGDGESRKGICNCGKSKCLHLFCECFAAGVYCSTEPPCSCINCHNIPIYKKDMLASRKKIESRNPLAFAPKIISRSSDPIQETRDDASKTPASGYHRRGCNCKKSKCSNKYCECFQGGVCCSTKCRCIGCGNKVKL